MAKINNKKKEIRTSHVGQKRRKMLVTSLLPESSHDDFRQFIEARSFPSNCVCNALKV